MTVAERSIPKPNRADEALIARHVLQAVRDLILELRPRLGRAVTVTLDSDLDHLGLDSLGRAELMLRANRTFHVQLPDALIGEMRTPADLLAAILSAGPPRDLSRQLAETPLPTLPKAAAPVAAGTLLEALDWHVREHPSRPHILLWQSAEPAAPINYTELDTAARRVAAGLLERGLGSGDRVAIMLPTTAEFFHAFTGALLAGGVPVPIYPPTRRAQVEEHMRRQAGILRNAEASILITNEEIRPIGRLLYGLVESIKHVETVASISAPEPLVYVVPARPETTALIQYTSGSTGDPKGVVLSHANLLANIRAMGQAIEASSADVFVSWLPLYHDMGLIGAWLACLYYGVPTVIMPPLAFLADPARWLRAIHMYRATLSAAPNFAFALCLKNIRDEDIEGVDLTSLRMVVNGAEPVSPSTIDRFTDRFRRYGFKPEAMAPVYGLAENAVGLAFPPPGRLAIIDRVDRDRLSRDGLAMPAKTDGAPVAEFVACGQAIPGHQLRIVDDGNRELPDRHEGRLQFKGPSATQGYFRNEEKNRTLFCNGWLESGDRAYIAEGDVYLTGRIKDMIIRAGRNLYPQELEELIGGVEGVRKGCVVAFASQDPRAGTERLVLVAETRLRDSAALADLRNRIADASATLLDLPPDEILLLPPGSVPKTSSGKLRRSAARQLYESGILGSDTRPVWLQLARLSLSSFAHRVRRLGSSAAEFAFAAWWWVLLCVIAAPVWFLVLTLRRRNWRHAVIHWGARWFLWLTGARLTVEAETPVPPDRVMLVANHSSYLDAVALSAAIPGPLSFVAKEELSHQFVAGMFLSRVGTLFARRFDPRAGVEDTEAQFKAAQEGERIVSMPEGTLSRMPGLLPFHLGAFLVAAGAGIPVVTVTVSGTRSVLRGEQWFPRRGHIHVHIGAPLMPTGTGFDAAIRLRDAARTQILSRCGEPDLADERAI